MGVLVTHGAVTERHCIGRAYTAAAQHHQLPVVMLRYPVIAIARTYIFNVDKVQRDARQMDASAVRQREHTAARC